MVTVVKRFKSQLLIVVAFMLGFGIASMMRPVPAAAGIDLGDILEGAVKIGGVKLAIDEFGDELDDLINELLENNDASVDAATKVVPIISLIGNKHVGAAQVVGPADAVEKVGAVVQLETSFMDKLFRVRAMVPIEGEDPAKLHRVKGVAVSAMIDIKL